MLPVWKRAACKHVIALHLAERDDLHLPGEGCRHSLFGVFGSAQWLAAMITFFLMVSFLISTAALAQLLFS